jgi:hypothetical protein
LFDLSLLRLRFFDKVLVSVDILLPFILVEFIYFFLVLLLLSFAGVTTSCRIARCERGGTGGRKTNETNQLELLQLDL